MKIALIIGVFLLALGAVGFQIFSPLRDRESLLYGGGFVGLLVAFLMYLLLFDRGAETWRGYLFLLIDLTMLMCLGVVALAVIDIAKDDFSARWATGKIVRIDQAKFSVPGPEYTVRYGNGDAPMEVTKYAFDDGEKKVGDEVRVRIDDSAPHTPFLSDSGNTKSPLNLVLVFGAIFLVGVLLRLFL